MTMTKGLHFKGRTHKKKRNVGLQFEFLVRHIIDSVLNDNDEGTKVATAIMKRHFRPGTELYREWRLFNAVIKTMGVDETMANAIIRETRGAVRKYDRVKLDREKSRLIHDVNHKLGKTVYDRGVPNYRMFATVQTLFNDWRDTGVPNISRIAEYEKKLQEHLMMPVDQAQQVDPSADPSQDAYVVKLMAEKLNRRYDGKLNALQRSLLSMYAFEGVTGQLRSAVDDIRSRTLELLDDYRVRLTESGDKFTVVKLKGVRDAVDALDTSMIDDTMIARFLKLCELKGELEQ